MAGFLGACFFLILARTSTVVPIAEQPMAESRMYLPLAAVVVFVTLLGYALGRRRALVVLGNELVRKVCHPECSEGSSSALPASRNKMDSPLRSE
jgi:hypothetical protein